MACTFCSGSNNGDCSFLTPEEIADTVKRLNVNSIIVIGGEAFLLGPAYYKKLLSLVDVHIDFTSNLKAFFLNSDAWIDVLTHPNVSLSTSFNYGSTRLWDKNTIYSEDMFKRVIDLFYKKIGYVPIFISVIDQDNEHLWRQHIDLAKELGTLCRLNGALKIGKQDVYFPRYKMFKIWIQCVKEGLDAWEINSKERGLGRCSYNTNDMCETSIRVLEKVHGQLRFSQCDNLSNMGLTVDDPCKIKRVKDTFFNDRCYYCELCRLCNNCRANALQVEEAGIKEEYCKQMLLMKDDIISLGWKL